MRQVLYYVTFGDKGTRFVCPANPVLLTESTRPTRVWTLFQYDDPDRPPALPFIPVHGQNAFAEDYMHDWTIQRGQLIYRSRVTESPLWILLEYK